MNILDTIIQYKKNEIARNKQQVNTAQLEKKPLFTREILPFSQYIKDDTKTGIITEFKRKSPSKGVINEHADVIEITKAYTTHGASCLSILTDQYFFGGSLQDLTDARINPIPILRKDFTIDEYQIIEAKAYGSDAILLIAACLTPSQSQHLAAFAKSLGLEVLLELYTKEELYHICDEIDLVGINNRNLKTFEVNWQHSIELADQLPSSKLKIAESGIDSVETLMMLKQNGFNGFLIGENFMKEKNPADAFTVFVNQLFSSSEKKHH